MDVHLRGDEANGTHTRFTVFMGGGNCGQLCMTEKEALFFHDAFIRSPWFLETDNIKTSGRWFKTVSQKRRFFLRSGMLTGKKGGSMIPDTKQILLEAFDTVKKQYPTLTNLSFAVAKHSAAPPNIYGWVHTGRDDCSSFESFEELEEMLEAQKKTRKENEILYRQFSIEEAA